MQQFLKNCILNGLWIINLAMFKDFLYFLIMMKKRIEKRRDRNKKAQIGDANDLDVEEDIEKVYRKKHWKIFEE